MPAGGASGPHGVKSDLLREARAFHALGLDVLLVDFRGSGDSGGDETSIGFHEAKDGAFVDEALGSR